MTESLEHIFPSSMGGKKRLALGTVCKKCNRYLGDLDRHLKKEHPAMMFAYQIDPQIKGHRRGGQAGRQDRQRKQIEKVVINGIGEAKHTIVSRENRPDVNLVNADYIVTSETFVRALHKCAANTLCDMIGVAETRENYQDLLYFVRKGGDARPWSYAVSYSNPFKTLLISEPKVVILPSNQRSSLLCFVHVRGMDNRFPSLPH